MTKSLGDAIIALAATVFPPPPTRYAPAAIERCCVEFSGLKQGSERNCISNRSGKGRARVKRFPSVYPLFRHLRRAVDHVTNTLSLIYDGAAAQSSRRAVAENSHSWWRFAAWHEFAIEPDLHQLNGPYGPGHREGEEREA